MIDTMFQILPAGKAQTAGRAFAKGVQANPVDTAAVKAALPALRQGIVEARQTGKIADGLVKWLRSLKLTTVVGASRDQVVTAVQEESAKIDKSLAPLLGTILAVMPS